MRRCKCGFLVDADIDGEICPSCGGPIAGKLIEEDLTGCQECIGVCNCEDEDDELEDDCYEEDIIGDEDDEDDEDEDDDDGNWFPNVDDDEEED